MTKTKHEMLQNENKTKKLATPKLNQAPYHVISQCFNVYVLLEGGHSVKIEIQQIMAPP